MALNNVDKAWIRDDTRVFKETPAMQELRKLDTYAYGNLVATFEMRMPPEYINDDEIRAVYKRAIAEMKEEMDKS